MSMPGNILDKRTVQIGFIGLGLMGAGLHDAYIQQAGTFKHGTVAPGREVF